MEDWNRLHLTENSDSAVIRLEVIKSKVKFVNVKVKLVRDDE